MYKVHNFTYNGFCGKVEESLTAYEADFIKWTNDPGVGIFKCTDNIQRIIPTFAIVNFDYKLHPTQKKIGIIFGSSSSS